MKHYRWLKGSGHFIACLVLLLPICGHAQVQISPKPLFLEDSVKNNLILDVDDSGSMADEVITDGSATDEGLMESWGPNYTRYNYYLWSPYYNEQYYNPNSTYKPWPSTTNHTFTDSNETAARYDPIMSHGTLDLVSKKQDLAGNTYYHAIYYSPVKTGAIKYTYSSCPHSNDYIFTINNAPQCYRPVSFTYDGPPTTETSSIDCSAKPDPQNFTNWTNSSGTPTYTSPAVALGPDGQCLGKTKIAAGTAQATNFANWFTYYRKRHEAIRGAIGEALQGIKGLRAGIFWIDQYFSKNGYPSSITMHDLPSDTNALLDANYDHFNDHWGGGSTPLRPSLVHAGKLIDSGGVVTQACQKNFTLLFTDGFNNIGTSGLGNADGSAGVPYQDGTKNTLADVAWHYYDTPLTSFKQGLVKKADGCDNPNHEKWLDCKTDIHMDTYTIGLGAKGQKWAGQTVGGVTYDSVEKVYQNDANGFDWPSAPANGGNVEVDDLYHAAVNGHGEFYQANSVDQLRSALKSAVQNIVAQTGSASNVTFNTATLEQGSQIFAASFNSGKWSGDLKAETLDPTTGDITGLAWNQTAAQQLDSRTSSRFIITYNQGGVPFSWSSLSTSEQADLKDGSSDAVGKKRLDYIAGDRSEEGKTFNGVTFRVRNSRLGDIIDSSPVYVGAPSMGWPDRDPFGGSTSRYSSFKQANINRTPIVYTGANDGMLHGFNAKTGAEVMAYIPGFVYSTNANAGLHYLTDPSYQHRYYVDLPPAVSDVYFKNAWHTILVGGSGLGGRSLFALDVTDPSKFNLNTTSNPSNIALWEFSNPNLGVQKAAPMIALTQWGANDYRWSLLVPNGYNSDNGETGLFVIDIAGGLDGVWSAGTDYRFIDLGTGSGLSALRAVDYKSTDGTMAPDGIVDRVYAGDLDGNVWAINLDGGSNKWGSAYKQGNQPEPLFKARDSSGNAQPITAAPVVANNIYDSQGSSPNLLVYVGTGSYIANGDPTITQTQSFYGIWDHGQGGLTRQNLVSRSITSVTVNKQPGRLVDGTKIDWTQSNGSQYDNGWYLDFDKESGERIVTSAMVRGQYVVFSTVTPSKTACSAGGSSWLMFTTLDGKTPSTALVDTNGDHKVNNEDTLVAGLQPKDAKTSLVTGQQVLSHSLYSQLSSGKTQRLDVNFGSNNASGRSGWHEVQEQ